MSVALVQLKKEGYDPFIDFLKGLCIIAVVLNHALPTTIKDISFWCLWGDMAVPIFLMIQIFHTYKRGLNYSKTEQAFKITKRIVIPFLVTIIFICGCKSAANPSSTWIYVKELVLGGGGPGSYYPWVYIQFAIILAFIRPIIKKVSFSQLAALFVFFSFLGEILLSFINLNSGIYRVLFFRYIFLIPLVLDWLNNGFIIDYKRIFLSFLGLVFILLFHYTDFNMEPLFNNNEWRIFHWICYFWVAYALTWLINMAQKKMINSIVSRMLIIPAGKRSYEIFLIQMVVFSLIPQSLFALSNSQSFNFVIWFLGVTTLSLLPVILYQNHKQKELTNR